MDSLIDKTESADDPLLRSFRERFNESLLNILKTKADNCVFITKEKYFELINLVRNLKNKSSRKTPTDYQRLKRYDVIKVGDCEKLVSPVSVEHPYVKFFVYIEEMFDILHKTHLAVGHGGRNKMTQELKVKYRNITKEAVMIYLSMCETCLKNKPRIVIPKKYDIDSGSLEPNEIEEIDFIKHELKHTENEDTDKSEIEETEAFLPDNHSLEEPEEYESSTLDTSEITRENEFLKRKLLLMEHTQHMKVIKLQYENELLKQKLIKHKLRKYEKIN